MININNRPSILVIGDLMIDHYLWGSSERISPEAPVPVVDIKNETTVLGGAGNVINNLRSLGSDVGAISVVGKDSIAVELKELLTKTGTQSYLIEQDGRKTSKKSRIMASRTQVVRYDQESKNSISLESEKKVFAKYQEILNRYELIILSDYGKGVLTESLCLKIIDYANEKNKKVLVDPKGEDYSKYSGAYLLTPNKKEAEVASKIEIYNDASLKKSLLKLKEDANLTLSVITLSENGIAILDNDEVTIKPTVAREVYDVTGAGDTVIASLGFALSLGNDIYKSIEFANLAAGVVVGKIGSATTTIDEITEYESSLHKSNSYSHIKTVEEIAKLSEELKQRGKKVVFTNGCFDILHVGHVKYLETAKSFGDVLVLGLNSDDSVKRLKGPSRPVNTQEDRAYTLAALESVDYVVLFEDDTPYDLIKTVSPQILVKGGDYEGKDVVGQDLVDELKLVEFVEGRSTTRTIQRIKENEANDK